MANYPARFIWMNGEYVAWPEAKVHVSSDTVLRGANVFEGLRAYYSPDQNQMFIFRLEEHLDRLWKSMKVMRMTLPYSKADLAAACTGIVARNGFREDLQVRVIAYFGEGSVYAFEPDKIFTGAFILATPRRSTLSDDRGIACCVTSWRRISDNVMPPRVKAGANYHQSRLVSVQARVDGYDNAIILNDQDKVSEGPGACLMIVRDGRPITPLVTAGILESITRTSLAELMGSELRLPLLEREIDRTELYLADEAFFCGSAYEVLPITSAFPQRPASHLASCTGREDSSWKSEQQGATALRWTVWPGCSGTDRSPGGVSSRARSGWLAASPRPRHCWHGWSARRRPPRTPSSSLRRATSASLTRK